ncbi:MAG: RDD family protein [Mycobacterium sp.]|nr:RDD family protein [Mycobacterium sp.]
MIDFAIIVVVALLLGYVTFHRISGLVTSDLPQYGVGRLLSSHGDVPRMAADVARRAWHEIISYVRQAFVALVLIQFLYQFLCLASRGRTAGKALLGVQVRPFPGSSIGGTDIGWSEAARRAAVTTVAETGLYGFACVVLVAGHIAVAVLCWLVAVAGFTANVLPMLLDSGRRTLGDRMSGTYLADAAAVQWGGVENRLDPNVDQAEDFF